MHAYYIFWALGIATAVVSFMMLRSYAIPIRALLSTGAVGLFLTIHSSTQGQHTAALLFGTAITFGIAAVVETWAGRKPT